MKKSVSLAFVMALTLCLGGCASHGNENLRAENDASIEQKIAKGETNRHQVRAMMGSPDETTFTDGGSEIWKYSHVRSTAKGVNFIPVVNIFASGADHDKKELIILFDETGVVKNYSFSETRSETRGGLTAY